MPTSLPAPIIPVAGYLFAGLQCACLGDDLITLIGQHSSSEGLHLLFSGKRGQSDANSQCWFLPGQLQQDAAGWAWHKGGDIAWMRSRALLDIPA